MDMDAPCICGPYLNCLTHKGVTLRAAGRAGGGAEPVAVLVFAPGVCWAGGGLHSSLGPSPCIPQPRGHSRASKLPKARSSEGTRWLLQCVSRQARVGNGGTCQCQCSGQAHPTRVWGTKCCWAPFVLLFAMVRISCLGGAKRHPQLTPHAVLVHLPSKLEVQDISETHVGCVCEHASWTGLAERKGPALDVGCTIPWAGVLERLRGSKQAESHFHHSS